MLHLLGFILALGGFVALFFGGWFTFGGLVAIAVGALLGES